jgi:hypothetical protein
MSGKKSNDGINDVSLKSGLSEGVSVAPQNVASAGNDKFTNNDLFSNQNEDVSIASN